MKRWHRSIGWLLAALLVLGAFAWLMWGYPGEEAAGGAPTPGSAPAFGGPGDVTDPSDGG